MGEKENEKNSFYTGVIDKINLGKTSFYGCILDAINFDKNLFKVDVLLSNSSIYISGLKGHIYEGYFIHYSLMGSHLRIEIQYKKEDKSEDSLINERLQVFEKMIKIKKNITKEETRTSLKIINKDNGIYIANYELEIKCLNNLMNSYNYIRTFAHVKNNFNIDLKDLDYHRLYGIIPTSKFNRIEEYIELFSFNESGELTNEAIIKIKGKRF